MPKIKPSKRFFRYPLCGDGKRIELIGFEHLVIHIDYDDVNHEEVDKELARLVDLLNAQWKD